MKDTRATYRRSAATICLLAAGGWLLVYAMIKAPYAVFAVAGVVASVAIVRTWVTAWRGDDEPIELWEAAQFGDRESRFD